jgi:hypothetical protein
MTALQKILLTMTGFVMLLNAAEAGVLENGNFYKGTSNWEMAVPSEIGVTPPAAKIEKGEFHLGKLRATSPGYLTLNQAVNIRKGKKYKLTYEAKGEGAGQYLVALHDPGKLGHVSKLFTPTVSWQVIEVEFTGLFDTDGKWVREWLRATKGSTLKGGRTVNTTLHEVHEPKGDDPSRTRLTFAIGGLDGSFAIRNVSIVEVLK